MTKKTKVNAAILIIGNEILSGRTQDTNTSTIAVWLNSIGVKVEEVRVIPDVEKTIIDTLNLLKSTYDYVFTTGGIGPTHDDITAEAIATAFNVPLEINSAAVDLLASHYPNGKTDINSARLRMCRIPEGATLIQNPISKAPGFSIENVFVMAGVPSIFRAMTDSTIPQLVGGDPLLSISVRIEKGEGDIATELSEIAKKHKEISIGSYPFSQNGRYGTMIVARHRDKDVLNKLERKLQNLM